MLSNNLQNFQAVFKQQSFALASSVRQVGLTTLVLYVQGPSEEPSPQAPQEGSEAGPSSLQLGVTPIGLRQYDQGGSQGAAVGDQATPSAQPAPAVAVEDVDGPIAQLLAVARTPLDSIAQHPTTLRRINAEGQWEDYVLDSQAALENFRLDLRVNSVLIRLPVCTVLERFTAKQHCAW